MWYVIQTVSGKEHEVCLWINTFVNKDYYGRCFVPLYEDVWRRNGVGHISIKRMFSGYLFLESDAPERVYEELRRVSQLTVLLAAQEKEGRIFTPIHKEEEAFFDSILSDGLMKVSYVHLNKKREFDTVLGPLQTYRDSIVRLDIPHRRAIVEIPMLGEMKRMKFGLWLDADPKLPWIEEEKINRERERLNNSRGTDNNIEETQIMLPDNLWDWKAWKRINEGKRTGIADEDIYGYKSGDYVINTTGIYGDTPLEIIEIHPDKNSVVVGVMLFGNLTRVEMGMDEIERA